MDELSVTNIDTNVVYRAAFAVEYKITGLCFGKGDLGSHLSLLP